MKNAKDLATALNGKKLPIVVILTIIGTAAGYGELKNSVKHNSKELEALKPTIEKVTRIDERVKGLKEDVEDIKYEQREMRADIKAILREVLK